MEPRRRRLPAPERFTGADRYRIFLGGLAVLIGFLMVYRMLAADAVSVPGGLAAAAFLVFGAHRLHLARTRYRVFRQVTRREP